MKTPTTQDRRTDTEDSGRTTYSGLAKRLWELDPDTDVDELPAALAEEGAHAD